MHSTFTHFLFLHLSLYPQSEFELQELSDGGEGDTAVVKLSVPFAAEAGFEDGLDSRNVQPKNSNNKKTKRAKYLIDMVLWKNI